MSLPLSVNDILDGSAKNLAARRNNYRAKVLMHPTYTELRAIAIANTGVVSKNKHGGKTMTQPDTGAVRKNNPEDSVSERFFKQHILGRGNFSKVQWGIQKGTGREVAIKTMRKTKLVALHSLEKKKKEIRILSSIKHPHIIQIYEIFENQRKLVLVMEYAIGGELFDYVNECGVLEEDEARRIFRQIATAIFYCHTHKICHRNIKLENILLNECGNVKIIDFGLSNVFDGELLLTTFWESSLYASPEIVNGTPYRGPEVDCWSLGVLLYALVYGVTPFYDRSIHAVAEKIAAGKYTEPDPVLLASPLIKEMLTVCPENRATIETICKHPWMNLGCITSCLDLAEQLVIESPFELKTLSEEPDNPKSEPDPDSIHQESQNVGEQRDDAESNDNINWCRNKLRSARKMLGRMWMCLREPQFWSHSHATNLRTSTMLGSSIEIKPNDEELFVVPTVVETTTV